MRRQIILAILFSGASASHQVRASERQSSVTRIPTAPLSALLGAHSAYRANDRPQLFDRHLRRAQEEHDMSADLREAISRIEGLYDPTRSDPQGLSIVIRMSVSPGTASMNNVFADRWRLRDTDVNVNYRVRYIAFAWHQTAGASCDMFEKRRPGFQIIELTTMARADCSRLDSFERSPSIETIYPRVAGAAVPVPVFAAPEPGNRMPLADLRAAQKIRLDAMREILAFRRIGLRNKNDLRSYDATSARQ